MQPVANLHIESRPDKCGGKPCITGTRVRVQDIYVWHELQGQSPDEIVAACPQLSMADIHAALAWYFDHREEIQSGARQEREQYEAQKRRLPSRLVHKLTGRDGDADPVP